MRSDDSADHSPEHSPAEVVRAIYRQLSRAWGRQHWWPAETPFEVIVGAILTQNTSWTNVECAIETLRDNGLLSLNGVRDTPIAELERMVRASGYFRQKAQRLKNFVTFVDAQYGGSLDTMFGLSTGELRAQLLTLNGVGPETADSILLYAGLHPAFVVDAYTQRVLARHDAINTDAKYDQIREFVECALSNERPLPSDYWPSAVAPPKAHSPSPMSIAQQSSLTSVYNEMHGLFVQVGKHYCHKRRPDCDSCPLRAMLSEEQRSRLQKAEA